VVSKLERHANWAAAVREKAGHFWLPWTPEQFRGCTEKMPVGRMAAGDEST